MRTTHLMLKTVAGIGMMSFALVNTANLSAEQPLNELGRPAPGTVQDTEDTHKQPDPTQMHSPESNRQVTLGGAQSFVEGQIWKIDGQTFEIRKTDGGERVQVLVNSDTNLDCASAPSSSEKDQGKQFASDQIPSDQQSGEVSKGQMAQGQHKNETARGAGFRIGQCDFHPGDRVKAEVDDMGRVTTLKYLSHASKTVSHSIGESAGTGALAIPGQQEKPGQLDMTGAGGSIPKEYAIEPVPVGEISSTKSNLLLGKPVHDLQGKAVGTLENFIVDKHSGRIEYAIVAIEGGTHLHPVPWSAIQVKKSGQDNMRATIDTSKYQLMPSVMMRDQSMDLAPSVNELVRQMQVLRDREPGKSKSRDQIVKEPAIGGPMGEEKAGGGGLSGERALPPEKDSPGFKREKDKRD
jgi:sporulation protein YlmC with PRC-barrel domain